MPQITVSDSTYKLILFVYGLFKDVFGSVDEFIKACVQEFYWRNADAVVDDDDLLDEYDDVVFRLVIDGDCPRN